MARIRTIKPEFFTSEDIVSLSPLARLLYIATWCEADKEGRLVWKPNTFKMRYLPGDSCDVHALCAEIVAAGLVVLYGDGLAHIPGFAKHQHVNPRESKSALPEPPTHVERQPSHIPANIRDEVMARDGGVCVRCGSDDHPQLDHILPQSMGGPHCAANLRVLCRSCNAGRPVSGQALVDDLAMDGFTIQSLRVSLGIDASIPDVHAQGGREGKGKEGSSVAKATDVPSPVDNSNPENPHAQTKAELWQAAVSVLKAGGCDSDALARSFMGKLVKDYGQESVSAAVASAATAQPADAREYLKATCQRLKGERKDPVTVADDPRIAQTAAAAEAERRRWEALKNDPEEQAKIRAAIETARQRLKAA